MKDKMEMLTKSERRSLVLSSLVCLVPLIAGIAVYDRLPAEVVTHWGFDGQPNGWMPKFIGVIVLPALMLLVNIAMPFLMKKDPKATNINEKLLSLFQWLMPAISLICSGSVLATALGSEVPVEKIVPVFIGFLFILIGNYLPKTKQSYTMGIKLPWTLNSEENWNRTHRLAGFLWVIGGFVLILGSIFSFPSYVYMIGIAAMVLVPVVYSYILYKRGI